MQPHRLLRPILHQGAGLRRSCQEVSGLWLKRTRKGLGALHPRRGDAPPHGGGQAEITSLPGLHPSESRPAGTGHGRMALDSRESIRNHGVVQPLIVRPSKKRATRSWRRERWQATDPRADEGAVRSWKAVTKELREISLMENTEGRPVTLEVASAITELISTIPYPEEVAERTAGAGLP